MSAMHSYIQQTGRFLGSRLARNIYFWVFILALKMTDIDDQFAYSNAFYYTVMTVLLLFFVGLVSFTNFFLAPRFLRKKQYVRYILATLASVFMVAFTYVVVLKLLQRWFPGIQVQDLSIVMSPIANDLSLQSIFSELDTYFVSMLVLCIIYTFLWFSNESIRKNRELQELVNKHRETELGFLRSQINPHFLFNTLNNLYSLSLKKSDETPEIILKLSSIMRYMLYESDTERVSFDKEKEVMQAYIDIELLRLPDSSQIQFSIMADKPYSIPPLLWLPVLENIFKHSRSLQESEIDFRFSIRNNVITIYSRNNKKVLRADRTEGGIGLNNLRKRLELLYPQKHSITISNDENYFIIEVQITLS